MNHLAAQLQALLLFVGMLSIVPSVFAARSISITGNKSSLLGDEELTVTASASGFTDGETIYIKGAFFQLGSTNYFGYTKSGDNWIKNSAANTSQREVKIGDWDGILIVKSDFSDSGYKGESDYNIKLGFYYGSFSSVNWSTNNLTVTINEPDPTPTNTPVPTDTPTPTLTPTPTKTPTPTPSPTPVKLTPTPTSTKTPTPTLNLIVTESASGGATFGAVLGTLATAATPTPTILVEGQKKFIPLSIAAALVGMGLAMLAGVLVWQKRKGMIEEDKQ